jgi:hypothetical protein
MGMRLVAKIVLGLICAALVFFGVGLLGYAIAVALTPALGLAGAAAIAGAIFVVPPFLWALLTAALRPARKPTMSGGNAELLTAMITGLAKEVPWIAIVGAGLAGVAELILKRKKRS